MFLFPGVFPGVCLSFYDLISFFLGLFGLVLCLAGSFAFLGVWDLVFAFQ